MVTGSWVGVSLDDKEKFDEGCEYRAKISLEGGAYNTKGIFYVRTVEKDVLHFMVNCGGSGNCFGHIHADNKKSPGHSFAVAYCQALFIDDHNSIIDLDKAEGYAQSAYEIFEKKLGRDDPRTLNSYLTLLHIRLNLKHKSLVVTPQFKVRFLGSEPTIDAAIALIGLRPESKEFDNLRDELSFLKKLSNTESYSSVYSIIDEIKHITN